MKKKPLKKYTPLVICNYLQNEPPILQINCLNDLKSLGTTVEELSAYCALWFFFQLTDRVPRFFVFCFFFLSQATECFFFTPEVCELQVSVEE